MPLTSFAPATGYRPWALRPHTPLRSSRVEGRVTSTQWRGDTPLTLGLHVGTSRDRDTQTTQHRLRLILGIHRCLFARSSRRRRHTPCHASATRLLRQSAPRASLPYHPTHAEHGASSGRCTRPSASPTVGGRCRLSRLPTHPSTSPLIRVETCESLLGAGRAEDQPALRIAHRRSLLRSCSLTSLSIISSQECPTLRYPTSSFLNILRRVMLFLRARSPPPSSSRRLPPLRNSRL